MRANTTYRMCHCFVCACVHVIDLIEQGKQTLIEQLFCSVNLHNCIMLKLCSAHNNRLVFERSIVMLRQSYCYHKTIHPFVFNTISVVLFILRSLFLLIFSFFNKSWLSRITRDTFKRKASLCAHCLAFTFHIRLKSKWIELKMWQRQGITCVWQFFLSHSKYSFTF